MQTIKYKNLLTNNLSNNCERFCEQIQNQHKKLNLNTVKRLVEIITNLIHEEELMIESYLLHQSNSLRSQGLDPFSTDKMKKEKDTLLLFVLNEIDNMRTIHTSENIQKLKQRNRYIAPFLYLSGDINACNNIGFFIDIKQRFPKDYNTNQIADLFNETFDHILDATKRSISGSITEEVSELYHEKRDPKIRREIVEAANRELVINSGQFSNQHINVENVPPIRNKRSNNSSNLDNTDNDNRKRVRWADYVTQQQTESRNNDRSI